MPKKHETFVDGLTAILVDLELVSEKEVPGIHEGFSQSSQAQFDDFLIEEGIVNPDDLLKALSIYYEVPSVDVRNHFFDRHLLHMFPKDFLLRKGVIPLERDENMLIVVASKPEESGLEAAIGEYVSYDIIFYVGIKDAIRDMVKDFYDEAPTEVELDIDRREQRRLKRAKNRAVDLDERITKKSYKKSW